MKKRTVDLGVYAIHIKFDEKNNDLVVSVVDELGSLVESLHIFDVDETEDDNDDIERDNIDLDISPN